MTADEQGCSSCGSKVRCSHRKGAMLAAIDQALSRLYPRRRWGDLDDSQCVDAGVSEAEGRALAKALAAELRTAAFFRRGTYDEYGHYVYVLCVGRQPCLVELRDDASVSVDLVDRQIREVYLRVCLSGLARMAAVQQCSMELDCFDNSAVLRERVRDGVYDAELLPRLQKLVAVLPRFDILSVDFGDISAPPEGYEPGDYATLYGGEPHTVNYLFYPQPSNMETTTWLEGVRRA